MVLVSETKFFLQGGAVSPSLNPYPLYPGLGTATTVLVMVFIHESVDDGVN